MPCNLISELGVATGHEYSVKRIIKNNKTTKSHYYRYTWLFFCKYNII